MFPAHEVPAKQAEAESALGVLPKLEVATSANQTFLSQRVSFVSQIIVRKS